MSLPKEMTAGILHVSFPLSLRRGVNSFPHSWAEGTRQAQVNVLFEHVCVHLEGNVL